VETAVSDPRPCLHNHVRLDADEPMSVYCVDCAHYFDLHEWARRHRSVADRFAHAAASYFSHEGKPYGDDADRDE
jgi:hypothetical protein